MLFCSGNRRKAAKKTFLIPTNKRNKFSIHCVCCTHTHTHSISFGTLVVQNMLHDNGMVQMGGGLYCRTVQIYIRELGYDKYHEII